ncbi:hypothetical protein [Sphingomonas mollis]|uniref:Uncharacterized protein n=1 Tax=Sphingomonas mollis TaxID=2795726 RepID=A0ABS0XM97_9SPHN|nr:hypothetical protein [Sphingomonas sp. BT553]MBJ6121154.1 hypothetical protein [Sphingomonas sp. BT553]
MKKVALIVVLALSGCAGDRGTYPSLAIRPTEKVGFAEPTPPPPTVAKSDPALDATLAGMTAKLRAIVSGFDADAARAERAAAAARGRPVGSDPWLTAQTALAALDEWRAQASTLASDASQLASDRAATLAPEYPGVDAMQQAATAEATRQDGVIGRIQASLPAA